MSKIKNVGKKIVPLALAGAGGIGAGYLSKIIPVENEKIKAAAPLAAGLLLTLIAKGKSADMISAIGTGLFVGGAINLGKSFGIGAVEADPIMDLSDLDIYGSGDDIEDGVAGPIFGQEDSAENEMPN